MQLNLVLYMYIVVININIMIVQTELPIGFGDGQTTILTLSPDQLSSPVISGEFRSLSFHFTPNNISSSILIHLVASRNDQVLN